MKLYRIQRKDNKKFFSHFTHTWTHSQTDVRTLAKPIFNDTGALFRKLETIERHLKWLCSGEIWHGRRRHVGFKKKELDWDEKLLKNYDIVIDDVLVKGTERITANKLFGAKK